jgi:hypothetical protein
MTTHRGAERALAKRACAARHGIQHRHNRLDAGAIGIAHGDGFCCARKTGIGGVDIQV